MKIKPILYLSVIALIVTGCVATAKLTDFPKSSEIIDFNKYSREQKKSKTPFWTLKTSNEYYIERQIQISETDLIDVIQKSLMSQGYRIEISDKDNKRVIGKRGMRANEWNSITGVYYKIETEQIQIYINTKITQDFTGGWRENRARKVGVLIEKRIAYLSKNGNNLKN